MKTVGPLIRSKGALSNWFDEFNEPWFCLRSLAEFIHVPKTAKAIWIELRRSPAPECVTLTQIGCGNYVDGNYIALMPELGYCVDSLFGD